MKNITKYLKDYTPPDYLIAKTNLDFEILEDKVIVISTLNVIKNNDLVSNLKLNGDNLVTKNIRLNGELLTNIKDYKIEDTLLTIFNVSDNSTLLIEVAINPFTNTTLMGIYKSNSCICSQCEPEGFRKITWYIDRPDVMSTWRVSITANKTKYPYLISNGNVVEKIDLDNNRQKLVFVDLLPKPSYLFALVAGNFDVLHDSFITQSNRTVNLAIYVEPGKLNQSNFAMESLKKSMKWDEDTFNLEYELDIFSIVAVSDFNFGAMENKSLNIFNDALILANPEIATDTDYFNIESVVAHEYFHNFTGDRITCRDWFQLTLKEGLTVYRDHIFSQDMHNADIVRINSVEQLKATQFTEDKGPLSHPIRPTSYIEMNNFYTSTVYEKGAEVIRMIATILGMEVFKKGIAVYFEKFDGQAVTCEDFILSMEVASGKDFSRFKNWYLQSGTPEVTVEDNYNATSKVYTLSLSQKNKLMPEYNKSFNLVIPLKLALFSSTGKMLELEMEGRKLGTEYIAMLEEQTNVFVFNNIPEKPVLSINRDFSAPIILNNNYSNQELQHLVTYDTNGFIKYNSMQTYLLNAMVVQITNLQHKKDINLAEIRECVAIYKHILNDYKNNLHLTAILLKVPSFTQLESRFTDNFPIEEANKVIKLFELEISNLYYSQLLDIFNNLKDNPNVFSAQEMATRALKNKVLAYIALQNSAQSNKLLLDYYYNNTNITNKIAALLAIKDYYDTAEHKDIYNDFYNKYINYPTVLNKWFNLCAAIPKDNIIEHLNYLTSLDTFSFSNPNKVRYLVGGFVGANLVKYNSLDGSGYKYLGDLILKTDKINPSLSAGLAKSFTKKHLYDKGRQVSINEVLNTIIHTKDISKGLFEIVDAILNK